MVADKIDMSLDDIISSNRKGRGRGGRGGGVRGGRGNSNFRRGNSTGPMRNSRGRGRGNTRNTPYSRPRNIPDKWEHDMYENKGVRGNNRSEGLSTGSQLQISNLDFGVTESDIKELFSEFGKLKKTMINYDESGRSHGTANVIFERQADAAKAITTYNGVLLDGRPMKIEAVTTAKAVNISNMTFGRTNSFSRRGGGSNFRGGNQSDISDRRSSFGKSNSRGASGRGAGQRGGRGGGQRGGRGGNRGRGGRRPAPSKDDLDKELDSYIEKTDS